MRTPLLLLLGLLACDYGDELVGADRDGDGYGDWVDCDDDDAAVNPGITEIPYNNADDDCDPQTLDDDLDRDGARASADCDDLDPLAVPGGTERCDGIDNDCDGTVDDGVGSTWYADVDGDGFGDPLDTTVTCDPGSAWSLVGGDCDDTDAAVHPEAFEVCNGVDDDCDDRIDIEPLLTPTWYADTDSDGFGDPDSSLTQCDRPVDHVGNPDDCDDGEATIHPGAEERCDPADRDCDGDPIAGATDVLPWFFDGDGDTYGDSSLGLDACTPPPGYEQIGGDCDDFDYDVNPLGTERCNGKDDDCDGPVDEDPTDPSTFYADTDGDGFGDPAGATEQACAPSAGFAANDDDCDDSTGGAVAHPGGTEICDGRDNDCNGQEDDAFEAPVWFADLDSDGFGDPTDALHVCEQPSSYVGNPGDCDDTSPAAAASHPGAAELCDGYDNDCDRQIDEGLAPTRAFYLDRDGDGFGDAAYSVTACAAPPSYSDLSTDCDDDDAVAYPGAPPRCGIDADCDGDLDHDTDGDGYIDASACPGEDDCDDDAVGTYPGMGCAQGRSCREAHEIYGETADGRYWIDPDGVATGNAEIEVWCDLTLGTDKPGIGWTAVFDADFEDQGQRTGWNFYDSSAGTTVTPAITTCGGLGNILGGYNATSDGYMYKTVSLLGVPHDHVAVEMRYIFLDTWDGELGWVQMHWERTYNEAYVYNAGTGQPECGWGPYDEYWVDGIKGVTYFPANSFVLYAGANLQQNPDDESFAIDDVVIWVR